MSHDVSLSTSSLVHVPLIHQTDVPVDSPDTRTTCIYVIIIVVDLVMEDSRNAGRMIYQSSIAADAATTLYLP